MPNMIRKPNSFSSQNQTPLASGSFSGCIGGCVSSPLYNKCSIKPPGFPQRAAKNVEKTGQSGARARSHGVSGAGACRNLCPGVFHSAPGRKGKTERPGAAEGGSSGAFLWESGRRNSPYRSPAIGNERGGSLCRGLGSLPGFALTGTGGYPEGILIAGGAHRVIHPEPDGLTGAVCAVALIGDGIH